MQIYPYILVCFFTFLLGLSPVQAQEQEKLPFFAVADTFNKGRFWTTFGIGAVSYTGAVVGLNQIWYSQYPRSSFQLFNDWDEWNKMDKFGHSLSAYQEARGTFGLMQWAGVNRKNSLWFAIGLSTLYQTTLEVLDGHSAEWGFSLHDVAFNTLGTGLFVAQELAWKDQRIIVKISSSGVSYPQQPIYSLDGSQRTTFQEKATELYGESLSERFFKDYNGQTIWLSANISSFVKTHERFPKWLNVAVGVGAENLYGGTDNIWETDENTFVIDPVLYPRYQQYYLSLDIDFTKIKTKNNFLRTALFVLNLIKMPAPALEVNSLGRVRFHPIHF